MSGDGSIRSELVRLAMGAEPLSELLGVKEDPNKPRPYFQGQKPSRCGHYYPDVMRIRDERRGETTVRIINCIVCGDYEFEIPAEHFSPTLISTDQIPELRESERKRIQEGEGRSAFVKSLF